MRNLEEKNTVKSENQVNKNTFFEGTENGHPRIMFVGNSITRHKPAPDIGWYGDWGMAASARDKDYVHLCIKHISEKFPNASFCIIQAAEWERGYKQCDVESVYSEAKDFNPDIIINRMSENIPMDCLVHDLLIDKMREFHKYLSGNNDNVKLIVTSNVFANQKKDEALRDYAEKVSAQYVFLNDLTENKENLANEYEHEGVRVHPGDKGMQLIADRLLEVLDDLMVF